LVIRWFGNRRREGEDKGKRREEKKRRGRREKRTYSVVYRRIISNFGEKAEIYSRSSSSSVSSQLVLRWFGNRRREEEKKREGKKRKGRTYSAVYRRIISNFAEKAEIYSRSSSSSVSSQLVLRWFWNLTLRNIGSSALV
jgi:hypothetical protein